MNPENPLNRPTLFARAKRAVLDLIIGIDRMAPRVTRGTLAVLERLVPPSTLHRKITRLGEYLLALQALPVARYPVRQVAVTAFGADRYREMSPARVLELPPVEVRGEHAITQAPRRPLEATYVARLDNARVYAPAMAVLVGNKLVQLSADTDLAAHPENYRRFFATRWGRQYATFNPRGENLRSIPAGILLANRMGKNYYHWVMECMPRLLLARDAGLPQLPFVVSEIPEQCRELARLFGELVVVADDEVLAVGTLYVPYVPAYSPDRASEIPLACYDDTYLPRLRREILERIGPLPDRAAHRVLYVGRRGGTTMRRILNTDAVVEEIAGFGGEVVYPGELTLREQIAAFMAADVVIGPAGAGFANMLFCRPGTTVIMLTRDRNVNPSHFGIAAHALGLRLICLAGFPEDPADDDTHASYFVDIPLLVRTLKELAPRQAAAPAALRDVEAEA
jgi:capsular polysaccharide biosynthesis protein